MITHLTVINWTVPHSIVNCKNSSMSYHVINCNNKLCIGSLLYAKCTNVLSQLYMVKINCNCSVTQPLMDGIYCVRQVSSIKSNYIWITGPSHHIILGHSFFRFYKIICICKAPIFIIRKFQSNPISYIIL